jgi:hypothetical protein
MCFLFDLSLPCQVMDAILKAVRHESLGKRYKPQEMERPKDCSMCPLNAFCGMKYVGTHRAVSRCPDGIGLSSPCMTAYPWSLCRCLLCPVSQCTSR